MKRSGRDPGETLYVRCPAIDDLIQVLVRRCCGDLNEMLSTTLA